MDAYLWIGEQDQKGVTYTKVDVYRNLINGPLRARSQKSVELRMRNISHVLDELGEEWVRGFVPAANVGKNVAGVIREILEKRLLHGPEYEPTANRSELERRTRQLVKQPIRRPTGTSTPTRSSSSTEVFTRDPVVRAWVLQTAKGHCESCGGAAPFLGTDGQPFLEVHHVRTLASKGSDTVENAVALCPNCHRQLHYGIDREEMREQIYKRVARLRRE